VSIRRIWRDEQTRIQADAAGGKLTEAQTSATQFANRMEDAEKNLANVEPTITQGGLGILKDRVARGITEWGNIILYHRVAQQILQYPTSIRN